MEREGRGQRGGEGKGRKGRGEGREREGRSGREEEGRGKGRNAFPHLFNPTLTTDCRCQIIYYLPLLSMARALLSMRTATQCNMPHKSSFCLDLCSMLRPSMYDDTVCV